MAGPVIHYRKRSKKRNDDRDCEDASDGKAHSSDPEQYLLACDPVTVVRHFEVLTPILAAIALTRHVHANAIDRASAVPRWKGNWSPFAG